MIVINSLFQYRPLDPSSLHFLKDITDDILRKGVYTDDSLEAVFNYHLNLNKHNLDLVSLYNGTFKV